MTENKKCIVMLSGGLDSRLAVKLMQEQGFEIIALFFNLPFGTGCCNERCSFNFSQMSGVKMELVDCSKGKFLQEYLDVLKKPKHSRGTSMNPCIDCRVFMFKKAREIADEKGIDIVVTGEVLGERPMSQHRKALDIVEEESGLKGRLLRPLSAKLLPPTKAEEKGIVDREKLCDISGRRRLKQIALAEKFKISYPSPGGGCFLCEKAVKKRLEFLLYRGMNSKEIKLANVGRHFLIDKKWVVLGRDAAENEIIEKLGEGEVIVPENNGIGPSAVILGKKPSVSSLSSKREQDKVDDKIKEKVKKLVKAYSKGGDREEFSKYSL